MEITVEQNTDEWMGLRRGPYGIRIGGSEAGKACGLDKDRSPHTFYLKIIAELKNVDLKDDSDSGESPATEHGHRCEDLVAEQYAKITGYNLKDANYWISNEFPVLYGASPDRKVYDGEGEFVGLLEIKAPYGPAYKEPKAEHITQMMFQVGRFLLQMGFLNIRVDVGHRERMV